MTEVSKVDAVSKVFVSKPGESSKLPAKSLRHRVTRYAVTASLCIFAVFALAASAQAGTIDYQVNVTVGAGSATGLIQTDGTLGSLSNSNILDWNLVVTDGTDTNVMKGPLSGNNSVEGSGGGPLAVTATAQSLSFDFSGSGQFYFVTTSGYSRTLVFCLSDVFAHCETTGPSLNIYGADQNGGFYDQYVNQTSSNFVFATTEATPEPGTMLMLGTGFLGLAGFAKRGFLAGARRKCPQPAPES